MNDVIRRTILNRADRSQMDHDSRPKFPDFPAPFSRPIFPQRTDKIPVQARRFSRSFSRSFPQDRPKSIFPRPFA
ncbi:hypothetical protein ACVWZA_001467 [Sphingomonas sp. UYAg733]